MCFFQNLFVSEHVFPSLLLTEKAGHLPGREATLSLQFLDDTLLQFGMQQVQQMAAWLRTRHLAALLGL